MKMIKGYYGILLDIDLSSGNIAKKEIDPKDLKNYIGGRGLGVKLLWNSLKKPGVDPLSPENPLLFLTGPFTGFPLPSASRTCVVTKSPITAPQESPHEHASTVSYSNMGGFFGPEIRFAGYDAIQVRGKADHPVYIVIDNDRVEIRDARKFWGMGSDAFEHAFYETLADRRFKTCYIGPAGENRVPYASIVHTVGRAASRGGTGCVMGAKNLKAIAVRGSRQPNVAHHKRFIEVLENARNKFKNPQLIHQWRTYGTSSALLWASDTSTQAVKNYREGVFQQASKLSGIVARRKVWQRHEACFVCPLACKKSGIVPKGPYAGVVHEGPEFENGTMLGANLMVSDIGGLLKAIYMVDDLGLDAIAAGNVIGFLLEAVEKKMIDEQFTGDVDLRWGHVPGILDMLEKIAYRKGVGNTAANGVKFLADIIGQNSHKFAIHCKGHTFAAWNCHVLPKMALCYVTANRGACHLNGQSVPDQNNAALIDSTGVCLFAKEGYGMEMIYDIMETVSGRNWSATDYMKAGERIFNLEKSFNYREGFRRIDDQLPDRFFEDPLTRGPYKGAVLDRNQFDNILNDYYEYRGWNKETSRPTRSKLNSLNLDFVSLKN